jgi:hypothetical protein
MARSGMGCFVKEKVQARVDKLGRYATACKVFDANPHLHRNVPRKKTDRGVVPAAVENFWEVGAALQEPLGSACMQPKGERRHDQG